MYNRVHYFPDKYHFPGTREQDFAKNSKKLYFYFVNILSKNDIYSIMISCEKI